MLKNGICAVILVWCIALPAPGHAASWSLATRVLSVGGTLQVRSGTPQTSANGTVFKTYTTTKNVPVTLQASSGYRISAVSVNGISQPLPLASNPVQMGLSAFPGKTGQGLTVSFTQQLVSITATAGAGGAVSPSGTTTAQVGMAKSYTFTPNPGFSLMSVSGAPAGAVFTDVSVTPNAAVNLPAPQNHAVNMSFTVPAITVPLNISGLFVGIVASAGPNQTVLVGQTAILSGSATAYDGSPSVSYAWSQTAGPVTGTLTNDNRATANFSSTMTGVYTLKLVATSSKGASGSATTTVTVAGSGAAAARSQCGNCHDSAGVGTGIYANWSSSRHEAGLVMCAGCHIGADTGGHPGVLTAGSVNESTFQFTGGGAIFCQNCHVGGAVHKTAGMTCVTCHNKGNIHNPDANFGLLLNVCFTCHAAANTTHYFSGSVLATTQCTYCHNQSGHNPFADTSIVLPQHFNGYTSYANPNYAAAYVTPATRCSDCHLEGDPSSAADRAIRQFRQDWAGSGHGDVKGAPWINSVSHNWKASADCQRCHTARGYVRFINMSGNDPVDATAPRHAEPLTCDACHTPDYSRRVFTIIGPTYSTTFPVNAGATVTTTYQISSSYWTNTDSNICMPCHSGTVSGQTIKQAATFADFTAVGRLRPHGKAAGGMIGKAIAIGYNYDETTYQDKHNTYHSFIGTHNYWGDGYSGPCVSCHMSGAGHSLSAVFKNSTGSITGVAAQSLCDKCHGPSYVAGGAMSPAVLNARKAGYSAALQVLKARLQKSGFDPDSASPKNWGETSLARANNMGAYFNYLLLRDGDKAAYVHGPEYARRLIMSSLNWLDDNTFNSSVYGSSGTIYSLAAEGRINPATRDNAISYLDITSTPLTVTGICANCHMGGPSSY